MQRSKTDLEALGADLHDIYDGNPWHGSSIVAVLDGIDAHTALRRSKRAAHGS